MDRQLGKKGLTIIAPEVQGSEPAAIAALSEEHDITYTVTDGYDGPRTGNAIPRMAVFDIRGKMVFSGHPMDREAEKAIKEALKEVEVPEEEEENALMPRNSELIPMRNWTNSEGRSIEASLISIEGNTGQFKFRNGQQFEYDVTQLSAEDQEVIAGAGKE